MATITLDRLLGRFTVEKTSEHWDDTVRGLGIRVNSDGSSVYISKYFCNKRQYKRTIAPCSMMTLDAARRLVMRMKILAKAGEDPADLIRSYIVDNHIVKGGSMTFGKYAKIYIEKYAKVHKKSWLKDQQRINFYLLPEWNERRLNEITRQDVSAMHKKVGKRAKYAANRLKELISTMFKTAIIEGYLPENHPSVVLGVKEFKERPRHEFIEPEQMPAVRAALATIQNEYHRAGIMFLLYTGLRSSEARFLKWQDVNLTACQLRVYDTKNGSDLVLPLARPAVELLQRLKRKPGNPYVFPGNKDSEPIYRFDRAWRQVREIAGIPHIRLHDLRRTAGSYILAATHSLPMVGKVLNQTNEHVTAIYSHYDKRAVRAAVDSLGATIYGLLEYEPPMLDHQDLA